jgi:hypothetical protein
MKITLIIAMVSTLIACGQESSKQNSHRTPSPDGEIDSQSLPRCVDGKISHILADGKTALLSLNNEPSKLQFWDINENRLIKSIDGFQNIIQVNRSAEFALRQLNSSRFQIRRLADGLSTYRENLAYPLGSRPRLSFSYDGKLVSVFYAKRKNPSERAVVFDIREKRLIWTSQFSDIDAMEVIDKDTVAIIATSQGQSFLYVFSTESNKFLYRTRLEGKFNNLAVTRNSILVHSGTRIQSYSINAFRRFFNLENYSLKLTDINMDFALVEDQRGAYSLIDTVSGAIEPLLSVKKLNSTDKCVLSMEQNSLFCIDPKAENSIVRYYLKQNLKKSYCLQSL